MEWNRTERNGMEQNGMGPEQVENPKCLYVFFPVPLGFLSSSW